MNAGTHNQHRVWVDLDEKVRKASGWQSVVHYLARQQWIQRVKQYYLSIQKLLIQRFIKKNQQSNRYKHRLSGKHHTSQNDATAPKDFWIDLMQQYEHEKIPVFAYQMIQTYKLPAGLSQLAHSDTLWHRLFTLHLSYLYQQGFSLNNPEIAKRTALSAYQNLSMLYKQNNLTESEFLQMSQQLQQHCVRLELLLRKQAKKPKLSQDPNNTMSRRERITKLLHTARSLGDVPTQLPLEEIRTAAEYRLLRRTLQDDDSSNSSTATSHRARINNLLHTARSLGGQPTQSPLQEPIAAEYRLIRDVAHNNSMPRTDAHHHTTPKYTPHMNSGSRQPRVNNEAPVLATKSNQSMSVSKSVLTPVAAQVFAPRPVCKPVPSQRSSLCAQTCVQASAITAIKSVVTGITKYLLPTQQISCAMCVNRPAL